MTKAAFTHGDVFASMFGSYLCGGDCIEDVMDIKPFWDNRGNIRICSSDVILRALRSLSEDSISYGSSQKKSYAFNVNEKMNLLLLKCLAADGYFHGVASGGGIIVGIENRDGNANVKFRQADTLERLFNRLEKQSRVVIQNFGADCGSFSSVRPSPMNVPTRSQKAASSRTSTFTFLMSSANVSKDLTRQRGSSVSCACSSLCQRSG